MQVDDGSGGPPFADSRLAQAEQDKRVAHTVPMAADFTQSLVSQNGIIMLLNMNQFRADEPLAARSIQQSDQTGAQIGGDTHAMGAGVQAFEYVDCVFHFSITMWSFGLRRRPRLLRGPIKFRPAAAGLHLISSRGSVRRCRTPGFSSLHAEEEGFEPPIPITQDNGFQDRRIQPLCHSSNLSWVLAPFRPSIKPSITYSPVARLPNKFRSPRALYDPRHPQSARWGFNQWR